MPVAPRIVNDVSYVTDIIHEIHFAWQAQYLVRLEGSWSVTFCGRRSFGRHLGLVCTPSLSLWTACCMLLSGAL